MDDTGAERHLTEEEIFALAAPAAGEPEALPRHLAHCTACGRTLQEWKTALQPIDAPPAAIDKLAAALTS